MGVGWLGLRHVYVCCFVLLTRYWGIVTIPGFPRVNRPQIINLGWLDPHLPPFQSIRMSWQHSFCQNRVESGRLSQVNPVFCSYNSGWGGSTRFFGKIRLSRFNPVFFPHQNDSQNCNTTSNGPDWHLSQTPKKHFLHHKSGWGWTTPKNSKLQRHGWSLALNASGRRNMITIQIIIHWCIHTVMGPRWSQSSSALLPPLACVWNQSKSVDPDSQHSAVWVFTKFTIAFWFLVCYAATQLALQLQQERIHVVRSNKVVRRIPTESNSTPAMDLGFGTNHVCRYRGMCV